mmetsp:Transcript_2899/g.6587  ORF Transcript_2899/g.6587 Transcript_2899/m.6587 type:complete len:111 (-) Transcript_2899:133-465(-)
MAGIVREGLVNTEANGEEFEMPSTTLSRILNEMQAPDVIDYLSIDVEGAEGEVLEGLDWDRWTVRLISAERTSEKARLILVSHGFEHIGSTGSDDFWASAELAAELTNAK